MTKKHAKSELILEQDCCNIARQKGLVAVKLEKNKHKGIPDYMFIQEGGKCLFVEFKRPDGGGVVSGEQRFWAKFLGYSHRFIDDAEEFECVIERYFE
jgi:hypothetical protein